MTRLLELLRQPTPHRYHEGGIEAELDALLVLAGHAAYTASTLPRYREHVRDAGCLASRLEQYRAHFLERWAEKAVGAGLPSSAHLDGRTDRVEDTPTTPRTPSYASSS